MYGCMGRGSFRGVYGPLRSIAFGELGKKGELCKNGWPDLNDLCVV